MDLARLRAARPFPNRVEGGALALTGYRSVEFHQQKTGWRTLRGGDPRTFYLHPPLSWKVDPSLFARVLDLVEQDQLPAAQHGFWDICGTPGDWAYPRRAEQIVFLAKGRATPPDRVTRFVGSLLAQEDQEYGVIVIDDGSPVED